MKTFLDCVPCIITQSVESPKRLTDDPALLTEIVKRTTREMSDFDMSRTPPEMGGVLNRIISEVTGVEDPYLEEKRRLNKVAFGFIDDLRVMIESFDDPFEAAVRVVMAANIMDFGAPGGVVDGDLKKPFVDALKRPLAIGGKRVIARLKELSAKAKHILYIADNTGEIVLDRLLIERMPAGAVTVAVRSGPAINDALMADAHDAGLHKIAEIIKSGAALPGTPYNETSKEFKRHFEKADFIISKGQGNFETMSDLDAPIFFLLTAKCHVVAEHLGCKEGDFVAYMQRKI